MKYLVSLLLCLGIVACSSTPKENLGDPAYTRFGSSASAESGLITGHTSTGVKITFQKDGQWERITSTGSSNLKGTAPTDVDQAIVVATLRARSQMAEFIGSKVASKKAVMAAIGEDPSLPQVPGSADASRLAERVVESITQTSQAMLTGTIIENEYVDAEARRVQVTVYVDRRAAAAAWRNR